MGTQFMATTEAPIHENVKRQIVENTERDTVMVFREFNNSARVARNSVSEEIAEVSSRPGATVDDIAHLANGKRGGEEVYENGNVEGGPWWAARRRG